ncbi:MAG: hypothetical protein H6779_00315 [Candidatus Nomurabacteria bacterium]|nr:MAG: hypothetical protein H6779_00315 [Candidatus Nomurabacteria bacterium]
MSKSNFKEKLSELQTLIWTRNKRSAIELTKQVFSDIYDRDRIEAHSLLLYVYDCFYYQQTLWDKIRFALDMRDSAKILTYSYDRLNLRQTNTLLNHLIRHSWWPSSDLKNALIDQALQLAENTTVNHNTALAHILKAESLVNNGSLYDVGRKEAILAEINTAENLLENHLIRSRDLETLRQIVLIYERISDTYGSLGNKDNQHSFMQKAYTLATCEACIYTSIITIRLGERLNKLKKE